MTLRSSGVKGLMVAFRRLTTVAPLVAGLALGLSAILVLHACARDGNASASASAATPQEAIAQLVEARGDRYAGLCEQTRSPEDIGKVCSRPIETRDGVQAHLIGRTFSEFSTWVFVAERDGGFTVLETEPLDFHDTSGYIPWPK
jgi:hypothetical protein